MTLLIFKVVSLCVIAASFFWLATVYIQPVNPAPVTYKAITVRQPTEIVSGYPAHIAIERLGVSLSVLDGEYNFASDSWTLTDTATHFASMTAQPNNKQGNTFIYGHNTAAVLEPVKNLVPGDLVSVTTTNGHTFHYIYTNDMSVTPDQTNILSAVSEKPQLTLMTCQGITSDTRRIMHFDYIGMS